MMQNSIKHFDTLSALEEFLREPLSAIPQRQSYPPYSVIQSKDGNTVKIKVALAGYTINDVEVEFIDTKLHIRGNSPVEDTSGWEVQYKGIAARKFDLSFIVNSMYAGESAEMQDGILTVTLERVAGFAKKLQINATKLNEIGNDTRQLLNE